MLVVGVRYWGAARWADSARLSHPILDHDRPVDELAAGKGKKGSLRRLKRRLSDVVLLTLVEDRARANPGGQMGATLTASAVDQIPKANTSDRPQPGFDPEVTPRQVLTEAAS